MRPRRPALPALLRLAALSVTVTAGAMAAAGCQSQATLDRQQQEAEARECVSLVVRNVAQNVKPKVTSLDGVRLDLAADPAAFFAELARLRPPSSFDLDAAKSFRLSRSAYVGDRCKPEDVKSSSSTASHSASTGTPTAGSTAGSTSTATTTTSPSG